MLIAAGVLAAIALVDRAGGAANGARGTEPRGGAGPTVQGVAVRASLTTNIRASPGRQAELIAIIPGGRVAQVTGQTPNGDWLRVVYPVGSRLEGWVPAANMEPLQGDPASLAVIDVAVPGQPAATPGPGVGATPEAAPLPDLAITNAFVAPNGTLTIRMANIGRGRFDAAVGLRVTSAAGEVVGVIEIERALLLPGRSATVNTQVEVRRTGEYVLELDWLDEVREANEFNNQLRTLLVAPER
ncbi:MAG: hypothetical protein FJZ92_01810 [Chloroflexi bacterium]|nr:hypothetical protein [Chloroflexota bacterium]